MPAYDEQQLAAVRAHLEKIERRLQRRERQDITSIAFHVAKTDASGVTARVTTTPGTGTVTLYHLDGTSLVARTDSTGAEVTEVVYNLFDTAIGVTTWVQIVEDVDGTLWIVGEEC